MAQSSSGAASTSTDFDLHGTVGIRCVYSRPDDARIVAAQLGLSPTKLDRDPDIIVRFVPELPGRGDTRYIIMEHSGFDDDSFLAFRSDGRKLHKARIRFEQIGTQCEIECETGLPEVPMLIPIVNLAALSKNVTPVHAAAFHYENVGILSIGWPNGGKTSAMMAFMVHGAAFVGDDWVYINAQGEAGGLPEPIKLHDWQIKQLPMYRGLIGRGATTRFGAIRLLHSLEAVLSRMLGARSAATRSFRKLVKFANRRMRSVVIKPSRLFGSGYDEKRNIQLHRVFLMVNHESPSIRVEQIEAARAAQQIAASLRNEWRDFFMEDYNEFLFAFPDKRNALIDSMDGALEERIARILGDKPVYTVYHPHPVDLEALFQAMLPYVTAGGSDRVKG